MNDQQFEELSRKLDLLIKLTAVNLVKDKKSEEQIKFLSDQGFRPKEIADTLATTQNVVNIRLSEMCKRGIKK